MTDLTQQVAETVSDAIFTEASKAFFEAAGDDIDKRVTALLSMYAPRLARAAIDALQLTEKQPGLKGHVHHWFCSGCSAERVEGER